MSKRKHLRTILRRREWLTERIAWDMGRDLSYDRAEKAALDWVIEEMRQLYPDVVALAEADHREQLAKRQPPPAAVVAAAGAPIPSQPKQEGRELP